MDIKQSTGQPVEGDACNPIGKDGLCLLSLDGGGVRGLSSLHILKRIMDEMNRLRKEKDLPPRLPCQVFDIIGGTSTGGLIAIMLGRLGLDVDECIKVYEELMESIFGVKARWLPISVLTRTINARYDSRNVKTAIEDVLRKRDTPADSIFNDGNKRNCRVFVCCVSKDTGDAVRIRSYNQNGRGNIPATICEAALATSAATSYFDPVSIGSSQYVDGALRNNNPISEVEAEAQDLWCPDDGNSNEEELPSLVKCFLSIGTGALQKTEIPDNILKLMSRLSSLATDTEATHKSFQDRWRRHLNTKRFFRFDVAQGLEGVGLAAYKKQGTIVDATDDYLDDREQQIKLQACAENLMKKGSQGTPLNFHEKISSYKLRVLQGSYDIKEVRDCRGVLHVTDVEKDRNDLKCNNGSRVPGTFEWIITNESYRGWLSSGPDTLWITARAGRGKTMLSLFILEDLEQYLPSSTQPPTSVVQMGHDKKVDLYYFFCSNGEGSRRDAIKVLRSLIYQIVVKHERLMKYVLDFLQPMASGSERCHETNRPTDADDQPNDKNEKQSRDPGKNDDQRSRSVDKQDPAPRKFPMKSSLMEKFFRSGTAVDGKLEDNVETRKEARSERKERSGNKSIDFQNMLGQSHKGEYMKDEPEKEQESQSEITLLDSADTPERESPKSRQLELLGVSELSFVLGKLIQELDVDTAYFLLDGADECGREEQEALISTLLNLCDVKPGKFKLLVVSRPISGMGTTPTIKLEQITSDIEKFISSSVEQFANVDGFNEEIRGEVERRLLKGAEGTFLWVSLVMGELKKKKTCTEILATTKSVPKGLNNKYSHMLQQIGKDQQHNVYQILRWVTAAFRHMTLQELSVVIEPPSNPKLPPEQIVRDAVTSSEGLLEVRANQVTFVHTSVKEFLLSAKARDDEALKRFIVGLEQLHYECAQYCYDYIQYSDLSRSEIKVSELSDEEEPKMLKYAIKHWMEHVKTSDWAQKNFDSDANFFRRESKLRKNWWTAYLEDSQNDDPKNFNVKSLVHLAAYFGIVPWIKQAFEGKGWIAKHGSILMELDHYNRTPLHIAVEQGHGPVVRFLLDHGIQIDFKEASQFATPLHLAARNGHKDICEILLKYKARVNARNRFAQTPLTEAARGGYLEVVKLLVDKDADINGSIHKKQKSLYRHIESVPGHAKRKFGKIGGKAYDQRSTPVIEAARRNHVEIIRYLVRKKADIEAKTLTGRNALHIAAYHGQLKSMEVLVELGANIEKRDDSSYTPLFLASWKNHAEAVKWLLDHDASIDSASNWGFTPLLVASRNGHVEPIKILLEAQAKIEYQDEKGHTALNVAALWGKVAVVKVLIEHGANIEAQNQSGNTALMQAIQVNLSDEYMEIVKVLLKHGANVNHRNRRGLTPLMRAAEVPDEDAADIVQQLLEGGAAIGAKDCEGRTVLMHAFTKGVEKTRELLLEIGAALEAKDDLGDTVLIIAAGYSDRSAVEWLLDRGADIEVRDNFGFTPLMKAAKCGWEDTVELLLDRGANIDAADNENKVAIDHAATRERGDIIKLLTSRSANRRKLTVINRAAAALSDVLHWTVQACREWERDWEIAELKKLDKVSSNKSDDGFGTEEEESNRDKDTTDADSEKTNINLSDEGSVQLDAKETDKRI